MSVQIQPDLEHSLRTLGLQVLQSNWNLQHTGSGWSLTFSWDFERSHFGFQDVSKPLHTRKEKSAKRRERDRKRLFHFKAHKRFSAMNRNQQKIEHDNQPQQSIDLTEPPVEVPTNIYTQVNADLAEIISVTSPENPTCSVPQIYKPHQYQLSQHDQTASSYVTYDSFATDEMLPSNCVTHDTSRNDDMLPNSQISVLSDEPTETDTVDLTYSQIMNYLDTYLPNDEATDTDTVDVNVAPIINGQIELERARILYFPADATVDDCVWEYCLTELGSTSIMKDISVLSVRTYGQGLTKYMYFPVNDWSEQIRYIPSNQPITQLFLRW